MGVSGIHPDLRELYLALTVIVNNCPQEILQASYTTWAFSLTRGDRPVQRNETNRIILIECIIYPCTTAGRCLGVGAAVTLM